MTHILRKIAAAALMLGMLSVTCLAALAQPAAAFSAFGYEVGTDGVHKAQPARENSGTAGEQETQTEDIQQERRPGEDARAQESNETESPETRGLDRAQQEAPEEADQGLNRARERANAHAMMQFANNDTYTRTALKEFDGDRFCVETEERMAYVQVNDDGSMELLNQEPEDCYEVSTSEQFVSRAWEQAQQGNPPTQKEFKENVKIPWGLKTKIFMNSMFS